MRCIYLIILLLSGCGSQGTATQVDAPIEPTLTISAEIITIDAQYIEHTVSTAYFNVSGSLYNDGDLDLNNMYYQVSGKDYYWGWAILKVSIINLPKGTNYSFTTPIENSLHEVLLVTGHNLPAGYKFKIELKDRDGIVLDTKYSMVVVI